jgi:hypothetical protein
MKTKTNLRIFNKKRILVFTPEEWNKLSLIKKIQLWLTR